MFARSPRPTCLHTATRKGGFVMPITRSGYATRRRNGSTRAYRQARAHVLAGATHCGICHQPFTPGDIVEADHIIAHADNGPDTPDNLRAVHRTCNNLRGRSASLRGGVPG